MRGGAPGLRLVYMPGEYVRAWHGRTARTALIVEPTSRADRIGYRVRWWYERTERWSRVLWIPDHAITCAAPRPSGAPAPPDGDE